MRNRRERLRHFAPPSPTNPYQANMTDAQGGTSNTDETNSNKTRGAGSAFGLGALFRELGSAVEKLGKLADEDDTWRRTATFGDDNSSFKGVFDLQVRTGASAREGSDAGASTARPVTPTDLAGPSGKAPADAPSGRTVDVQERREPDVDVFDEGDHVLVVAEMPGVTAQDVALHLDGDVLTITADAEDRQYATEVVLPQAVSSVGAVQGNNGVFEIRCTV